MIYCANCPSFHITIALPDILCQNACGTPIRWYDKLCTECSKKLNACQECGVAI